MFRAAMLQTMGVSLLGRERFRVVVGLASWP